MKHMASAACIESIPSAVGAENIPSAVGAKNSPSAEGGPKYVVYDFSTRERLAVQPPPDCCVVFEWDSPVPRKDDPRCCTESLMAHFAIDNCGGLTVGFGWDPSARWYFRITDKGVRPEFARAAHRKLSCDAKLCAQAGGVKFLAVPGWIPAGPFYHVNHCELKMCHGATCACSAPLVPCLRSAGSDLARYIMWADWASHSRSQHVGTDGFHLFGPGQAIVGGADFDACLPDARRKQMDDDRCAAVAKTLGLVWFGDLSLPSFMEWLSLADRVAGGDECAMGVLADSLLKPDFRRAVADIAVSMLAKASPTAAAQKYAAQKYATAAELEAELESEHDRLMVLEAKCSECMHYLRARFRLHTSRCVAHLTDRFAFPVKRDSLLAERSALLAERGALQVERDSLLAERNSLLAERDSLLADRNALSAERDSYQEERDALREERDSLLAERAALRKLRNALQTEHDVLLAEYDGILVLCEKYQEERDDLRGQRDAIQAKCGAYKEARDSLLAQRDALWAERDARRDDRDTLLTQHVEERSAALAERVAKRDALRAERPEAAPLTATCADPQAALATRIELVRNEESEEFVLVGVAPPRGSTS